VLGRGFEPRATLQQPGALSTGPCPTPLDHAPPHISSSFYVFLAVVVSLLVLPHVVACLTLCIPAGGVDIHTSTETVVLSLKDCVTRLIFFLRFITINRYFLYKLLKDLENH
jgi:hypothetical protein